MTAITASSARIVLTTVDSPDAAVRLARALVEERLAACVNVLPPMTSTYRWKGAIEEAQEQQLIIKTTVERLDELRARVKVLHPYEVPELLVLAVSEGSPEYLSWMAESTVR